MRIQLKISGGLAYFPALNQPAVIDSSTLSQDEAHELAQLLDRAHFFELPPVVNTPQRGAADFRQYTITVDDGNRHHTIQAADPIQNPDLQALIAFLRAHKS